MKVKMKNEEMYKKLQDLNAIMEDKNTQQQTGKLAYAMTRNRRVLEEETKDYMELRGKAIQKYGKAVQQEEGKVEYSITPDMKDAMEAFVKELGDVPDIEIDVDIFTVSEDEFCSGTLNCAQMDALLWMVDDKKGAKK